MATSAGDRSLHGLGVICGLAAGVWLGAAEAPTKLVNAGFSPFAVSLCMVAGVFTARWTFPTLLKGTSYVFADLFARKHLIVWAILAGALWAVANTLTVFAIRDVGLATAFPLWNTNSLIGLLWGVLLFRELRGAPAKNIVKVVCGGICIVAAAIVLGFSTLHSEGGSSPHALRGLLAAAGASLMWGTMYVPYRKAYLSGMNPLSFVTAFTVGELGTMLLLTWTLDGGMQSSAFRLLQSRQLLFWLFLGGFVWVIGDLFQQFATKYLGIGRGIPLSNTNQFWGLAWGALVFGELASANRAHLALVLGGSVLMIVGALAISTAVASSRETLSRNEALARECDRYGLDYGEVLLAQSGEEFGNRGQRRRWWDVAIVVAATGLFLWLGVNAVVPPMAMNLTWIAVLTVALLTALMGAGWALWRQTRSDDLMAVRLKDIAADLGVSTVTVSKVLRGGVDIGERTRARVLKRMEELNYQPNMQARGLASGRSFAVGLVVPDLVHPFFGELAKSLAGALRASGLALVLASSEEDPEIERQEIRTLVRRGVDVLVVASCQPIEDAQLISEGGPPILLIDRNLPKLAADLCGVE